MPPVDVNVMATLVIQTLTKAIAPLKARQDEIVRAIDELHAMYRESVFTQQTDEDRVKYVAELVERELVIDAPPPRLRQKRIVRDAQGRIDRVVDEFVERG